MSRRVEGGRGAICGLLNQAAATLIRDASWLGYERPPSWRRNRLRRSAPSRYRNIAAATQERSTLGYAAASNARLYWHLSRATSSADAIAVESSNARPLRLVSRFSPIPPSLSREREELCKTGPSRHVATSGSLQGTVHDDNRQQRRRPYEEQQPVTVRLHTRAPRFE